MEPARYKDYILTLLFVKYVSERFKSSDNWDIEVPEGGSFDGIVALKYKKNIGEGINVIIGKLVETNDLKVSLTLLTSIVRNWVQIRKRWTNSLAL